LHPGLEVAYKPIAPVHQNDLELVIPGHNGTYLYLDIKLYVRGKLVSALGKDVEFADHMGLANNFLHSLFSQCNVSLNGVNITQASEHYHYRSDLETFMTCGTDDAATQLSNA